MRTNLACNVVWTGPAVAARIARAQAEQDRLGWLRQVHEFLSASGARCLLEHVTDEEWMRHYDAGTGPYCAVISEMERVSC